MLLDNLVYEVLTEVREMSDDGQITEPFVKHLINVYRAKYIQQEYSKRNRVNQSSIQSFNLKLIPVDSSTMEGINTGSAILESPKLPNILNIAKRPAILRIRTLDAVKGEIAFQSVDRAKLSSYSKFKVINAFLENNNKLYVVGTAPSAILLKNISVDVVLENPEEVYEFGFKDRLAGTRIEDYPIDLGMWAYVKQELIEHILLSYKVPNDNSNDQIDNKEVNEPKQQRRER